MARDFTKNTANYINLGTATINGLLSGASAVSIHVLANFDSTSTTSTSNNRMFNSQINGSSAGLSFNIDNNGVPGERRLRVVGRSTTADSAQAKVGTTDLSLSTWYSLGGVLNFTGDTITPYVNGAAENGGAATFGSNTYTPGTPTTGDVISGDVTAPSNSQYQIDGRMAEIALWNVDIGASGYLQLAAGFSALFVRPESLIFYMPIIGRYAPEIELISGKNGTVAGTLANADHPRIIYPSSSQTRRFKAAAAAGSPQEGGAIFFGTNF